MVRLVCQFRQGTQIVNLILSHYMELTIKLALINGMIRRSARNSPSKYLLGVNIMTSAYTVYNPDENAT